MFNLVSAKYQLAIKAPLLWAAKRNNNNVATQRQHHLVASMISPDDKFLMLLPWFATFKVLTLPHPTVPQLILARAFNETNNNADTCVSILHCLGRVADVFGFRGDSNDPDKIIIARGIMAYGHPNGYVIVLTVHEALWYGVNMDHSLINPNQIRHCGIDYWDNPYDRSHNLGICLTDDIHIPLITRGRKVEFESRVPTEAEWNDNNIMRFDITSPTQWEPTSVRLSEIKTGAKEPTKRMVQTIYTHDEYRTTCKHMDPRSNDADLDAIDPLLTGFNNMACINEVFYDKDTYDVPVQKTFISTERHTKTKAEALLERFGIGLHRARQTLKATRQQGARSAIFPLERRYCADRRYERRLKGKFLTNTAYFPAISLRGNKNSQIYYDKCGFASCHHIPKVDNDNVQATLLALQSEYGIPESLTMDGAAVQVGCHTDFQKTIRQNEIYFHVSHLRPNENDAEFINEFNRIMDDPSIPHAEDANPEANFEPEIEPDNNVDMIVAGRRNPEEQARVK